jgi:antitoxin component YwqK of YwqJK toxin-antitoxin module
MGIFKKKHLLYILPILLLGCRSSSSPNLVHLQIVDRNGYTQTISDSEGMKKYERYDLKAPSHHKKVIRVFDKDKKGVITLYHENGELWQYVETKNGRASGVYEEYYPNRQLHIKSIVSEGIADLTDQAKLSWIFDETSTVYDENGNVIATIPYSKGVQEGIATYFYPNGVVKRTIPYLNNKIEGKVCTYTQEGVLSATKNYFLGEEEGEAIFNGSSVEGGYKEFYKKGRLLEGRYLNIDGTFFSEIKEGEGKKPYFKEGALYKVCEYRKGIEEGEVTLYRKDGSIESTYSVINNEKHGEEICYYPTHVGEEMIKKFLITWREGLIHGRVCSWYPNGVLESEKEIVDHKKEGTYLSWYIDSSLMMVEEYRQDRLINGKYLRKGESVPISRVIDGMGEAHIYDKDGLLIRKISYYKGYPVE